MADPVTIALVASTVLSAGGQIMQGKAEDKAARFEARQLDRKAKSEFASGTREAQEQRRQGRIMQSNIRAQQAGGGGVTDDPQAIRTQARAGELSEYNALTALYSAETAASGLRTAAKVRRFEGATGKKASRIKSLSTVISGGAKAFG